MKIMNTNLENISHQKFLNINYGYRYLFDIEKGNIFNSKNKDIIRIDSILNKIKQTLISKGELDNTYKLINMENVSSEFNLTFDYTEVQNIESDKILIGTGDFLLPKMSAYSGKFILNKNKEIYICSTEFMEYKINDLLYLPKFFYYLFRTSKMLEKLKYLESGKAQRRLNDYSLSMLYLPKLDIKMQMEVLKQITPLEEDIFQKIKRIKSVQEIIDNVFQKKFKISYIDELKQEKKIYFSNFLELANDELKCATTLKTQKIFFETLKKIDGIKWINIGKISNIKGGKRLPKGDTFVDNETEYRYIKVEDLDSNGYFNIDSIKYISSETNKKIKDYIANTNNILVSIVGTIGKVGCVPKELDGENISENFACIVLNDLSKFNPKFIRYYLQTSLCKTQFKELVTKAVQEKLAIFRLKKIFIPYLVLKEQQEIIDEIEKQIKNQIEIKKEIFKLQEQISNIIERNVI